MQLSQERVLTLTQLSSGVEQIAYLATFLGFAYMYSESGHLQEDQEASLRPSLQAIPS